jgi:hypothetical protein
MIVRSTDQGPEVVEADDLQRLHVELAPGHDLGGLGVIDGDHAWLDLAALRRAGVAASATTDWNDRFSAMIEYATTKGWVDPERAAVRAHIERT